MKKFYLLLAALLLLVFTACGGNKSPEDIKTKDTIVVAVPSVKMLDPHMTSDLPSIRIFSQIMEPLVAQNPDMKIIPALAESWEQLDDVTTLFHLRKNAKFHNGEQFKASDVKFSLDRARVSPHTAANLMAIKEIEVVDDYTVKVITKFPFAPILNHLAHNSGYIVSEKAITEMGDEFSRHPIGTGPYKFTEWKSGDYIALEAVEDYYLEPAKIKNVIFKIIVDSTNRTIGLETKEIDIAYDTDAMDSDKIKADSNLVLTQKPSVSTSYLGMNVQKAPFDNVKVRQAVSYAIDKKAIVDAVYQGYADLPKSLISQNVFGFSPNGRQYERNIEKAKELLAEAGYPNGFKSKIWIAESPQLRDTAIILQDQLKEIGIDMSIETLEWGTFLDETSKGNQEFYSLAWGTGTGDADYGFRNLVSSKTWGAAGNRSFYANPRVDELLDAGVNEIVPEKRLPIYEELQILINEELPVIPLAHALKPVGLQKYVKGFEPKADGKHSLYGVYFE